MQSSLKTGQLAQNWLRREVVIAGILTVSLIAFELFNFDTTQFALQSLLGTVHFGNLEWASILAVAFCAIDFAGLVRFFTPQKDMKDEPKEFWFLMGAWFLGATMNAIMTWWAISLTLLNHNLGNEILSRDQLIRIVPIFVAVLVWLTRILFIGGIAVAGEKLFQRPKKRANRRKRSSAKPKRQNNRSNKKKNSPKPPAPYKPTSTLAKPHRPVTAQTVAKRQPTRQFVGDEDLLDDWTPTQPHQTRPNRKITPLKKPRTMPAQTTRRANYGNPITPPVTSSQTNKRHVNRSAGSNARRQRPPMPPIRRK